MELETANKQLQLIATPDELALIHRALNDFIAEPLAYDLAEMCSQEDMQAMAELCDALCKELFAL